MSDLQFDSENQNPSGKSGGIGGMIFLILFATPFAGFGVLALVQGIRKFSAGDIKNGPMLCLFGLIFSLVGFGLMFGAVWGRKKMKQDAELKVRFADKPWMMRQDWAVGKIKSSAAAQTILYLVIAVAFCGIGGLSTCFALPDVWQKQNYAALLVLLFPLVGISFLIAFLNAWRSQKRFGKCFFEPAQIPVPLGGILEGMIQTGNPLTLEHELNLKISCVRRVTTGSGKNRSTSEYILWQDGKIYSSQANLPESEPGQTGIPVHFKLPDNQPESIAGSGDGIHWRLEAKSKMHGPNFHVTFELPVFKVAGASVTETDEADATDYDPTAALQAPIEEIRRDENSKIKISDGLNGREFYFPAARNLGTAFGLTGFFIVWSGFLWFMLGRKDCPILFPIAFGLVDVFVLLGCINVWFKSSRVTIDSTNVRAATRWLIFSRTREFSAADVARFTTKTGMQSGSQIFTDILVVRRSDEESFSARDEKLQGIFQDAESSGPKKVIARFQQVAARAGVTVASSIANTAEANWLAAEMNKALGRK